jgi:hypothetical protein
MPDTPLHGDEPPDDLRDPGDEGRGEESDSPPVVKDEETVSYGSYRQLFESELHKLDRDERIALASGCSGAVLCAFCLDPDPGVILRGVLENPRAGLEHARLIAAHHRMPQGLEGLARRAELLKDPQVQRHLLRNPQAQEALLRRFLSMKPLQPLYQLMLGHELTDRARRACTAAFQERFHRSGPTERVGVIFRTEGRCLRFLIGVALDGRSAAMICERSIMPTLLVQNLARWPTCPPLVLRHLARQSTVRRNPGVMRLILQHPNCPREVKRG